MRGLLVGALLATLGACQARYQDGEWRCDASNACPDGYRCGGPLEDRRCYRGDHGFQLTLEVIGQGQGTLQVGSLTLVTGTTRTLDVTFGEQVTLTATALGGSGFFGWTGGCNAREPVCVLDISSDLSIDARFEPTARVDVVPTQAGLVVPSFAGGTACTPDVAECRLVMVGETAVVTVPPPATGSFGGWANAPCGGRTACAFTPTSTTPLVLGALANSGAAPTYASLLTAGSQTRTQVTALGSDADGNLYVGGVFEGTLPLGSSSLVSAGKKDVFVAKIAADRSGVLWASSFGSVEDEDVTGIALDPADPAGRIWVVGTFRGNLIVPLNGTPTAIAYGGGGTDGFIAAYDRSTGGQVIFTQLGDTGVARPRAITDALGPGAAHVLVVAGEYSGALRYIPAGGAASSPLGGSPTALNAFFWRVGLDGSLGDSQFRGATGDDSATSLDAIGSDVYVGGSYASAFDGLPTPGARDAFVLRYDASAGAVNAHFGLGSTGADETTAVAARLVGGTPVVWAAGTFESTAAVEGTTAITADGVGELFLVKLGGDLGSPTASVHGGEVGDRVNDLALDADGELTVGGTFSNPITFGGRTLNDLGTDAFLAKIDAARTLRHLHAFGSGGVQRGRTLTLRGEGAILGGSFDGDFASGLPVAVQNAVGIEDGFVVEVGP